jgi:DNA-binding NarL/FixJ family response regulator
MSKRLLIVDDEPNLLRAVAASLRAEGYETLTARTARDALVILAEGLPDLIISDVRMPGMDGYSFLRHLRFSPRTNLIPVIFLTAKDQKRDRIEGFRSGVDAYLTKPFEPDELSAIVASILSRVERTHSEIARLVVSSEPASNNRAGDEELTGAEWRIALCVARGLSNKEIAAEFGISVRTVENHISSILAKKDFANRVEIARHVLKRDAPDD